MRRLMAHAPKLQQDDGATAVIVAILIVVLLGMAAIVVDIGNLMWERRSLQNSADAAALAVAQDCAAGDCEDFTATAADYASENNRRGAHVKEIEPNPVTPADGEVRVTTETGDADDAGFLSTVFASVLGEDQTQTGATAVAAWEAFVGGETIALSISACELDNYLADAGLDPEDLPSEGDWDEDEQVTIRIQGNTGGGGGPEEDEADCELPSGGAVTGGDVDGDDKIPGAFRWLVPDEGCEVTTGLDDEDEEWAEYEQGASGPAGCSLADALNTTVELPVFDKVITPNETGCPAGQGDRCLRIVEYVGFHLVGFRTPGDYSHEAGANYCNDVDGNSCIKGYFTRTSAPGEPGEGEGMVQTPWLKE